ncbi:hypothetical protein VIOR3934_00775 [Vibrio orientalis CIP 102891 = ATCC 33934]|uniref:Alpha-L-rhamnosidase six-hairpin glycosidase domain-containing protein n=1 Tax=Vibrio orientalis CIP 102891 = ATCC 33934 TaxID=675816 RepID=C9QHC6_VIBOR|nr:hypothetical protein [Vibrio orientalis]EEX93669.1 hypothetical protein VIA_000826 [Vibrio orientalis CIP 102891 = ATCC 33934]EGU51158.1 hypothetical protein VIOR3934_00775 [Vibrio orientalis CIP 102891 = ATCC 33934]
MKYNLITCALSCALAISGTAHAKQHDNLLSNPSFEDKGLGWSYWFANIKNDSAYEGEYRGRIATGATHSINQIITIPETGFYDLSAYVISPSNDATIAITNLYDERLVSKSVKQSQSYKKNTLKHIALEQGEQLKVSVTGSNQGGVSVDNISLTKSNKNKPLSFNQIVQFNVNDQSGASNINRRHKRVEINVPFGTDLTQVTVDNFIISNGSSTTISQGDVLDLTQPMTITLSSDDHQPEQWTINAKEQPKQIAVTSSNTKLQDSFAWAMDKTKRFVMTGQHDLVNRDENNNDGSGTADYIPSYWAGYFDRTAFYSRDFLHQVSGAQLAGLAVENFSMFKTFAKHSTESRKWYTLWAVNFDGTPHTIDYVDDSWFVREVPAQFEFVEKAWQQYLWTGDERYIEDEDLWRFYTKVLTDYIALHDDQDPNGIAEGYGGIFEGSATYNERGEFPIEAGDAIGSQYQATLAYSKMLEARQEYGQAAVWSEKAQQLKDYFNQEWSIANPNEPLGNYVNIVQKDGLRLNDFGKENSWFMPMKRITNPDRRNDKYLDFIAANLGDGIGSTPEAPNNIEAYTYIPETYFPYNRNEEAWKWMQYIMDTKDNPHERPTQGTNGDYPELSFTFIANTIEGLMGIKPQASKSTIITASHLTPDIDWLEAKHIQMGEHELTIRHDGLDQTTLTNTSQTTLDWEAWFYGDFASLTVDGRAVQTSQKEINGQLVSYVVIAVEGKQSRVVAK